MNRSPGWMPLRRRCWKNCWANGAGGKTIVLANHDVAQSLRLAAAAGGGGGTGRAVILYRGRKIADVPAKPSPPAGRLEMEGGAA